MRRNAAAWGALTIVRAQRGGAERRRRRRVTARRRTLPASCVSSTSGQEALDSKAPTLGGPRHGGGLSRGRRPDARRPAISAKGTTARCRGAVVQMASRAQTPPPSSLSPRPPRCAPRYRECPSPGPRSTISRIASPRASTRHDLCSSEVDELAESLTPASSTMTMARSATPDGTHVDAARPEAQLRRTCGRCPTGCSPSAHVVEGMHVSSASSPPKTYISPRSHAGRVDRHQDQDKLFVCVGVDSCDHRDHDLLSGIAGTGDRTSLDHTVAVEHGGRLDLLGVRTHHARLGHGEGRADLQQRSSNFFRSGAGRFDHPCCRVGVPSSSGTRRQALPSSDAM